MKPLLLLIVLVLAGCAGSQQLETYIAPRLIEHEPFPALPQALWAYRDDLHMKLQIGTDGSVLHASLDHWSGDAEWDSLAVASIKRWRFTPASYQGTPVKLWIDLHASVKSTEPVLMGLNEIVCPTRQLADSVYTLLLQGNDFEQLALVYSIAPSRAHRGQLGQVDIYRFADDVHEALIGLHTNEFTSPLAVGSYFCIYKRVPWDVRVP